MDKYMLISTTKYGQSTGSMHYNPYQQKSFRDKLKSNGELRSRASSAMSNRLQNQENFIIIIIVIAPNNTSLSMESVSPVICGPAMANFWISKAKSDSDPPNPNGV